MPAISNWHRSVLSDLTSYFNFATPNDNFPTLPDLSGYAASDEASEDLPPVLPPTVQQYPVQELGYVSSRALPYELNVTASTNASGVVTLNFINTGLQGAVFHVFDQLNLNLIPRRYTVEAGKTLSDDFWNTFSANFVSAPQGTYNLWVMGQTASSACSRAESTRRARSVPCSRRSRSPTTSRAADFGSRSAAMRKRRSNSR